MLTNLNNATPMPTQFVGTVVKADDGGHVYLSGYIGEPDKIGVIQSWCVSPCSVLEELRTKAVFDIVSLVEHREYDGLEAKLILANRKAMALMKEAGYVGG